MKNTLYKWFAVGVVSLFPAIATASSYALPDDPDMLLRYVQVGWTAAIGGVLAWYIYHRWIHKRQLQISFQSVKRFLLFVIAHFVYFTILMTLFAATSAFYYGDDYVISDAGRSLDLQTRASLWLNGGAAAVFALSTYILLIVLGKIVWKKNWKQVTVFFVIAHLYGYATAWFFGEWILY